jgi:hypothetical protein
MISYAKISLIALIPVILVSLVSFGASVGLSSDPSLRQINQVDVIEYYYTKYQYREVFLSAVEEFGLVANPHLDSAGVVVGEPFFTIYKVEGPKWKLKKLRDWFDLNYCVRWIDRNDLP